MYRDQSLLASSDGMAIVLMSSHCVHVGKGLRGLLRSCWQLMVASGGKNHSLHSYSRCQVAHASVTNSASRSNLN